MEQSPRHRQELAGVVGVGAHRQRELDRVLQLIYEVLRPWPLRGQKSMYGMVVVALSRSKPTDLFTRAMERVDALRRTPRKMDATALSDLPQPVMVAPA